LNRLLLGAALAAPRGGRSRSYMVLPLGESDDPRSPHFDDQAEKLFSAGRAKPTYFLNRRELARHVTRTTVLDWPPAR